MDSDARALLDAMPDGVLIVDEQGNIVTSNRQAEALFGWSREELTGKRVEELVPQASRADHARRRERYASDARVRPMGAGTNLRAVRRDGIELDVQISLAPYVRSGRRYVVAAVRDSSERVRAERNQKRLELELRNAQRLDSLGRLAGGVAHDFNNLLSVVLGVSSLLVESLPQGDPIRADLALIEESARRATALTQQLLAFGRRQILEPSVIAVDRLVRRMEAMLRRVIGENVELVIRAAKDAGRARVDPGQLEQVILNLAVNARDAMPAGGTLTIETSNVDLDEDYATRHAEVTAGRYVMLAVSDNGTGMDDATAARVFEPFFTTKEPGKGTGLGLATVHGVVKQSDGHIAVYSEPGRGTVFKVYLPRAEEPETLESRPPPATSRSGRGETILVVEDNDLVRVAARRILGHAGYSVLTASDAREALDLARTLDSLDLLLTDVVMPGMGGHELALQLAELKPGLRVLYMSGYTENTVVHHGIRVRGAAFVQKPLSSEALTRRVREALDAPPGA
jgi:PAS domain S-box-containing protein